MRHILALLPLLGLSALPSAADDLYVRQGASGNGSGSDWTNACTNFTNNCDPTNLRGDTVYVAAGTYSGDMSLDATESSTTLAIIKRATVADHGTSTGWNNGYDGQAKWTGLWTISTGYWTVDGVTGKSWPLSQAVAYGFSLESDAEADLLTIDNDAANVTIKYMKIDGVACCEVNVGTYGLNGSPGANFLFSHGAIVNIKNDPIHFNGLGAGSVIEHTYVSTNGGLSTAFHGQAVWMNAWGSGAEIRYNLFQDNAGTAVFFCGGESTCDDVHIYGNVFYHSRNDPQNGQGGTYEGDSETTFIFECPDTQPCDGMAIYNNTIVGWHDWHAGMFGGTYTNLDVKNNLWYNIDDSRGTSGSYTIFLDATHDYNRFLNVAVTLDFTLGNNEHSDTGQSDPFVDIDDLDFRIADDTSSTHLNDGVTLGSPYNVDPDGNTRGGANGWTKGAYQFTGAVSGSPTVSPGRNH